jgi:hypothetical protein
VTDRVDGKMEPGLLLAIGSAGGALLIFIIRTTTQVYERFDKLSDRLTVEEIRRESNDDALKKEVDYKLELHFQQSTMQSNRMSEILENVQNQITGLERTIEALHKRLDALYSDISGRGADRH